VLHFNDIQQHIHAGEQVSIKLPGNAFFISEMVVEISDRNSGLGA
jgi:hypothetical protein